MHASAGALGKLFFDTYTFTGTVLDIGSADVNGSLKPFCKSKYIGVDFSPGKGVDVVLDDPYKLPFDDGEADAVVSSSCFEHSEMFWLVFLEVMRVLKPEGIFYLNAPSNGMFHRYPVDCWRFYPDAGNALVTWAKRNGYDPMLLESFTAAQTVMEQWNDFVAVFIKDRRQAGKHPRRMLNQFERFSNGLVAGKDGFLNETPWTEDMYRLRRIGDITTGRG